MPFAVAVAAATAYKSPDATAPPPSAPTRIAVDRPVALRLPEAVSLPSAVAVAAPAAVRSDVAEACPVMIAVLAPVADRADVALS